MERAAETATMSTEPKLYNEAEVECFKTAEQMRYHGNWAWQVMLWTGVHPSVPTLAWLVAIALVDWVAFGDLQFNSLAASLIAGTFGVTFLVTLIRKLERKPPKWRNRGEVGPLTPEMIRRLPEIVQDSTTCTFEAEMLVYPGQTGAGPLASVVWLVLSLAGGNSVRCGLLLQSAA